MTELLLRAGISGDYDRRLAVILIAKSCVGVARHSIYFGLTIIDIPTE